MFIFNEKDVKKYLEAGGDINFKDNKGNGFLFKNFRDPVYQKHNNIEVLKAFIKNGIDINTLNNDGDNALFGETDKNIVNLLINSGININHINKQGKNALSSYSTPNIALLLFKHNISVIDISDEVIVSHFLRTKDVNFAKMFIEKGMDVNITHNNSKTNVFSNKQNEDMEIVDFFLEKKVKYETRENPEYFINEIGDKVLEKLILSGYFNKNSLNDIAKSYIELTNHIYIENKEQEIRIINKIYMFLKQGIMEDEIKITNDNKVFKIAKASFEQEKLSDNINIYTTKNNKKRI